VQEVLGSTLDLDSVDKGTYVCGGLGDPARLHPSEQGDWNEKATVYATSLAYKDFATLDAFAGHMKGDPMLPAVLARARKSWYRLLNNPPSGAFDGRVVEVPSVEEEQAPQEVRGPDADQPPHGEWAAHSEWASQGEWAVGA